MPFRRLSDVAVDNNNRVMIYDKVSMAFATWWLLEGYAVELSDADSDVFFLEISGILSDTIGISTKPTFPSLRTFSQSWLDDPPSASSESQVGFARNMQEHLFATFVLPKPLPTPERNLPAVEIMRPARELFSPIIFCLVCAISKSVNGIGYMLLHDPHVFFHRFPKCRAFWVCTNVPKQRWWFQTNKIKTQTMMNMDYLQMCMLK